jgi:hypothetical protein
MQEHDWVYVGPTTIQIGKRSLLNRFEFRCTKCELLAFCKSKKLIILQIDYYKDPGWEDQRISFSCGRWIKYNGFISCTPPQSIEPNCVSDNEWVCLDILI